MTSKYSTNAYDEYSFVKKRARVCIMHLLVTHYFCKHEALTVTYTGILFDGNLFLQDGGVTDFGVLINTLYTGRAGPWWQEEEIKWKFCNKVTWLYIYICIKYSYSELLFLLGHLLLRPCPVSP
jgi:hypothetical protein